MVVFSSAAFLFGACSRWFVTERGASFVYRFASLFGVLTALFTGMVWTIRFIHFWGMEMIRIPIVASLVVFVLGVAIIAGVFSGIPLMYARRRCNRGMTG
jgi:hypothetical protein